METTRRAGRHEAIARQSDPVVHEWRADQLRRLGIPGTTAEAYADYLDWHQIARLVQRGCPQMLALRIVY
jgi:hypothetical protein